jgi:hypothetical protein
MRKIVQAIFTMSFEELKELQKDISNNNEITKKAMWQRMEELSNSEKFCATCFRELKNPKYTLIVGDKYKRKLSFCEKDCFKYYLRNIEGLQEEVMH